MSDCNHDCSNCGQDCSQRDMIEKLHKASSVKKVIGVVSGKGGVGKSTVTSLLAVGMNKAGYKTAIMDADITGPSIPRTFGLKEPIYGTAEGLFVPVKTKNEIEVVSINLLLESDTEPVIWRGPVLAGVVKQFWGETWWQNIDYMFVDMPPGTGDVPLTVFQSLPVDGIVIVTSPQELVGMIVEKAVNMAKMMNVPILGLVENYSYLECPDCGKKINVFGESHIMDIAAKHSIPVLGQLPINSALASACDKGTIEDLEQNYLADAVTVLEKML